MALNLNEDQLISMEIKIHRAIQSKTLADLGLPALEIIADRLNLSKYLDYFIENNKSTAEYHSNYHVFCVALNSYEGAQHEKLSIFDTRNLVLAAIFHEFDHSGGLTNDTCNVLRAIKGLTEAAHHINDDVLTIEEITQSIQILGITKYPYEKPPVSWK